MFLKYGYKVTLKIQLKWDHAQLWNLKNKPSRWQGNVIPTNSKFVYIKVKISNRSVKYLNLNQSTVKRSSNFEL